MHASFIEFHSVVSEELWIETGDKQAKETEATVSLQYLMYLLFEVGYKNIFHRSLTSKDTCYKENINLHYEEHSWKPEEE